MLAKRKDILIFEKWCYVNKERQRKMKQKKRRKLLKWKYLYSENTNNKARNLKKKKTLVCKVSRIVDSYLKRNVTRNNSRKRILRIKRLKKMKRNSETDKKGSSVDANIKLLQRRMELVKLLLLREKFSYLNYKPNKSYDEKNFYSDSTSASSKGFVEYIDKGGNNGSSNNFEYSNDSSNGGGHNVNHIGWKKWEKSFINGKQRSFDYVNQVNCSRSVEVHTLFTFFCTKLKVKDKEYFKNKNMLHKIPLKKNDFIKVQSSKEYSTKLSNEYIPKNKEKVLNDIRGSPNKAPPYKNYNNSHSNMNNAYNNCNNNNCVNDGNDNSSEYKENVHYEDVGNNVITNACNKEEQDVNNVKEAEINEDQFADEFEFDDFDSEGNRKEKTYYTDRCMLDKSVKRESILDKLNLGLDDKKSSTGKNEQAMRNKMSNGKGTPTISMSTSDKKEQITNKLYSAKSGISPSNIPVEKREKENLKKEVEDVKNEPNKEKMLHMKNNGKMGRIQKSNNNMKHSIQHDKMFPPKKGPNKNYPLQEVQLEDKQKHLIENPLNSQENIPIKGQMGYDMKGKMGYNKNSQMGYNMNNQVGYNMMNGYMGYDMNNHMGYDISGYMDYSMNSQMGHNMNSQMGHNMNSQMGHNMNGQMGHNLNSQIGYTVSNAPNYLMNSTANWQLNNPMNMSTQVCNISTPFPLGNGNENLMNNEIANYYSNFGSYNNNNDINENSGGDNQMITCGEEIKNMSLNNKNLVLYNKGKLKYDEDFTLNYILQKCEDDDKFFCSNYNDNYNSNNNSGNNNFDALENVDEKRGELRRYTNGMNRLVEQMYFYDNFYDEYKICDEKTKSSSSFQNIVDTSLNLNVHDENSERVGDNQESKQLISKMELKINEIEKNIKELKGKEKTNGQLVNNDEDNDDDDDEKKKKKKKQ
ncbi:conserved Plasmodium protein, unknown function [Plasmodium malariae]|uniref:Uncharacterized protein n=1 Tax=Plasmodium malariae TaxID=5858 RepID=A0A1A8W8Q0_PLAMA|nr:conserved Plasmodium protein, unknown function [Plasmodium malariae]